VLYERQKVKTGTDGVLNDLVRYLNLRKKNEWEMVKIT
jgi:hypothetical protein